MLYVITCAVPRKNCTFFFAFQTLVAMLRRSSRRTAAKLAAAANQSPSAVAAAVSATATPVSQSSTVDATAVPISQTGSTKRQSTQVKVAKPAPKAARRSRAAAPAAPAASGDSVDVPIAVATAVARTRRNPKPLARAYARRFDMHLKLLKEYKQSHGGRDPSRDYSVLHNGTNVNLGKWCHNQRQKKNRKQLSQACIDVLDSVDFTWGGSPETAWKEYFELVKTYKAANHGNDPPQHYSVQVHGKTMNIGTWCRTQRYRKNSQKLSQRRINKLNSINFTWGRSPNKSFDENFQALKAYKQEHGE